MTTRRTDWALGITVEGLGNAAALHDDKKWRFARMYLETTTGGGDLYVPALTEYPSSFAAEVDFRAASSSLGGFAIEFQAQGTGDNGVTVASRMYRSRYVPIGFLGTAMTSSSTTIQINDADGTGITSLSDHRLPHRYRRVQLHASPVRHGGRLARCR